ncbi:tripartite tricarboxylate transporter substrate binding protein [Comamonas resistens]|uniref:Tripartite tricarboxylate transporter substrate binding protein n=1 Tax=Comamonas resistens TaxID=3046670 RepID=A0ABY8SNU8_9BURK|nr:tripartite tricarboxylate transporter substrate binding protein [Comamonas resistens]MDL5036398.1 tripartite tricarboxylate transporter substrate binding protein [Comamonas resistens]WHS64742.1 tripartite tricarboxylate transporter substrate binding protein [Comamonas resistens]
MSLIQKRRSWVVLGAAALAVTAVGLWHARTGTAAMRFEKPITIVVTFPPGGGTDLLARKLGAELQQRIAQPVVVENRPGASGNIGARAVAEAAPDGTTLLMANSSFAINPGVYRELGFDPHKDFKAVFNAGTIASVLVVPQHSNVHGLADVLAQSSADKPLAFASCGNGTPQHMAGEMLTQAAHMRLQHVPYKGCGPAISAVAADQVPLGMVTASSAAPLIEAGRVRAIAVTAPTRVASLPDIPTLAEQGVAGFAVEQWHGLLAPAATPEAVIARLHQELAQILAEPAMQQSLRAQGYTLVCQSSEQFGQLIAADMERYAAVTAQLGLKAD